MSSITDSPGEGFRVSTILYFLFYGLLAVVALPSLILAGALMRSYRETLVRTEMTAIGGLVFLGGIAGAYSQGWYFENILFAWLATLLSFPFIGLLLERFPQFADSFNAKTPEQKLQEEIHQQEASRERIEAEAEKTPEIPAEPGQLRLGRYLKAGDKKMASGIAKTEGWITLEETLLDTHMFLLGATGAGKSETIKRLIYEVLTNTERDVILIDGKGERKLAYDVQKIAYRAGRGVAPIFWMGVDAEKGKGDSYNPFVGSPEAIYNRLVTALGFSNVEGDSRYYAEIGKEIMRLICQSPQGAPRSFTEAIERVDLAWLNEAWQHSPRELKAIKSYEKGRAQQSFDSIGMYMRTLGGTLEQQVNESGFTFDNTRVAIFSMRVLSLMDDAQKLFEFLFKDLNDFVGQESRQTRSAVIIIDEFGLFPAKAVTPLLKLARSAGVGIILATQDLTTIGDEKEQQDLLANTTTYLLMKTNYPEQMGMLAGTVKQLEASIQLRDDEETGMGSARVQDAFKIDMNNPSRLAAGQAYLIRDRRAYKMRTALIPQDLPDVPAEAVASARQLRSQQAEQWLAQETRQREEAIEKIQQQQAEMQAETGQGVGVEDLG